MTPTISQVLFACDACLVPLLAWLLVRQGAPELENAGEQLLTWGLATAASIAAAGVLLGATGGLQAGGFLVVHAGALGLLGLARRRLLRADLAAARALASSLRGELRAPPAEAILPGLLAVIVVLFLVLAAVAQPVVYDALSYRLPRIGQWLQDGSITAIETDDARLNYMPVVPDLIMAWLLTASASGFQPAALAQTLGGLLTLGATFRLARLTGLGRTAAFAAAALVLGLPNVAPQFTSLYTDLLTAGGLAAGFSLGLSALRRGQGSWFGGLGVGFALAAKGTVVFFAPGLAAVGVWLAWRERAGAARAGGRTLLAAGLATALFAGPTAVHNLRTYGHAIAPREFIVWHQGEIAGGGAAWEKLRLNLVSSLAQLAEPNSQPPWLRPLARLVGEPIARRLPESDPFAFDQINRRANLEKIYAAGVPDADVTSTGILIPALCLLGVVIAWRRRTQRDGQLILAWGALVLVFLLVLHARLQWHPFLFRFVVLAAPWMAVIAAWAVNALPATGRIAGWTLVALTTLHGLIVGTFCTYQGGWPAATQPGQSIGFHVYRQWRAFAQELAPAAGPLRPHLPVNQLPAAFYRRPVAHAVVPGHLSQLGPNRAQDQVSAGNGWLIVPAKTFIGREGEVFAKTSLFDGDEQSPFSLAAYRALGPGEPPPAIVYRNRPGDAPSPPRRELLVRPGSEAPLRLELLNPGTKARPYRLHGPLGDLRGQLGPRERRTIEVRVPPNTPALLILETERSPDDEPAVLDARVLP